ncbi:MAG TPA: PKD domain-containing protein [Candidatus Angelobacter sp.]|nr:PKD domain-containing protein [Candidatus Angelobacter sp.]
MKTIALLSLPRLLAAGLVIAVAAGATHGQASGNKQKSAPLNGPAAKLVQPIPFQSGSYRLLAPGWEFETLFSGGCQPFLVDVKGAVITFRLPPDEHYCSPTSHNFQGQLVNGEFYAQRKEPHGPNFILRGRLTAPNVIYGELTSWQDGFDLDWKPYHHEYKYPFTISGPGAPAPSGTASLPVRAGATAHTGPNSPGDLKTQSLPGGKNKSSTVQLNPQPLPPERATLLPNGPPISPSAGTLTRVTADRSLLKAGQSATITIFASGDCRQARVDFGDGSAVQEFSGPFPRVLPPHSYTRPGTFNVKVFGITENSPGSVPGGCYGGPPALTISVIQPDARLGTQVGVPQAPSKPRR